MVGYGGSVCAHIRYDGSVCAHIHYITTPGTHYVDQETSLSNARESCLDNRH